MNPVRKLTAELEEMRKSRDEIYAEFKKSRQQIGIMTLLLLLALLAAVVGFAT